MLRCRLLVCLLLLTVVVFAAYQRSCQSIVIVYSIVLHKPTKKDYTNVPAVHSYITKRFLGAKILLNC